MTAAPAMPGHWARVAAILESHGRVARVVVAATRGSTPREVGAVLVMRPDGGFHGTVGGGTFEWRLLERAGRALRSGDTGFVFEDVVLGPDLGQCCGGRVTVAVEVIDRDRLDEARRFAALERDGVFAVETAVHDGRLRRSLVDPAGVEPGLSRHGALVERFGDDRRPLLLFGAGHVGRAVALALAPLPFRLDWIDGRDEAFPAAVPGNATLHAPADPVTMVALARPGSFALIMTHDHALDFAIVDACLRRADLGWIGVIGSATKRARFSSRLVEIGHTSEATRRMVCPVGAMGPKSKQPAAIAAAIAVDLLVADEMARNAHAKSDVASEVGVGEPEEWV